MASFRSGVEFVNYKAKIQPRYFNMHEIRLYTGVIVKWSKLEQDKALAIGQLFQKLSVRRSLQDGHTVTRSAQSDLKVNNRETSPHKTPRVARERGADIWEKKRDPEGC